MALKIPGGKAGSVNRLKKEMEKSQGGATWVRNVKAGEDLRVRFVTEPDEWYSYREHYDDDVMFFPCIGSDECPGCNSESEKTQRTSRRFLSNALIVDEGRVVPLKLPLDLANRLVTRYERYGNTIMDREYVLHRMGKGLDTTYDVTPETPEDLDVSEYQLIDLEQVLISQFEDAFDIEGESEATPEPSREAVREKATADLDEAIGFDEDDEDDEGDDEMLSEEEALKMSRPELVELAKQYDVEVKTTWNKRQMVDAIFSAASE